MNNITPGHARVFKALRSQQYKNIFLESCTVNGEPGVCIVMVDLAGEGKVALMPLFIAVTFEMEIDFPRFGKKWRGKRGGGGPKRPRENAEPIKPQTPASDPR